MAAITPTAIGSGAYSVTESRRLVADLRLDAVSSPPFAAFQLRFPSDAAGVTVTLIKGAEPLELPLTPPATLIDSSTFTNRRVTAKATVVSGQELIALDCEIRATSAAANAEVWQLKVSASAATTWRLRQNEDAPADPTITRVMCDPLSAFAISASTLAAGKVREKDVVTLTATPATGTATAAAVVGTPLPGVSYRWNTQGSPLLATSCSANPTWTFQAPPVDSDQQLTLSLDTWFETGCNEVGFLNTTSPAQILTVTPSPVNAMPDVVGELAIPFVNLLSCIGLEDVDHCLNFLGSQVDPLRNNPRKLGDFFFFVLRSGGEFDLQGDPNPPGCKIKAQFPEPGTIVPPNVTVTITYDH